MITITNKSGQPLIASVVFTFDDGGEIRSRTNRSGKVKIPNGTSGSIRYCTIFPASGYWARKIYSVVRGQTIECDRVDLQLHQYLWKELIHLTDSIETKRKLRVGVVDLRFDPDYTPNGVRALNPEGEDIVPSENYSGHGWSVLGVFHEICNSYKDIEVVFVEASDDDDARKMDFFKILAAIEFLSDELNVDIINISSGIYQDDLSDANREFFELSVRHAVKQGCLIIAAVGNDHWKPVAAPACFDDVVGVGSIGAGNLAPVGSYQAEAEADACATDGAIGLLSSRLIFHDVSTCAGQGLDIVAPGLGVFVKMDAGFGRNLVLELIGTSFASPIVASVAAVAFAADNEISYYSSSTKARYGRNLLMGICDSVGLSREREGWGVPNMKNIGKYSPFLIG